MISSDRIVELADEAAEAGDMLLSTLLLHLGTLINLSDYRAIEIMKNYAGIRARQGVESAEVWPELIDG
jgi:hypothetical protein